MAVRLNIPNADSSVSAFTLGESEFNFRFRYNMTDKSWCVDISDEDDIPILSGIGMKPNRNLTGKYLISDRIGGTLWLLKVTNTTDTLTRDNINTDYQLWYYTNDEELPSDIL